MLFQMYGFCPSNSVPPIFYGNNHFSFYGNFKLPLRIFQNKILILIFSLFEILILILIPWSTMKPKKMKSLFQA